MTNDNLVPALSAGNLAAAVRTAAITLLGEQVGQVSLWSELWRCLGRAEEAATAGDLASAAANLEAGADLEYDLTGSADVVGAVLAATGDEPSPPTTRTGQAPPGTPRSYSHEEVFELLRTGIREGWGLRDETAERHLDSASIARRLLGGAS